MNNTKQILFGTLAGGALLTVVGFAGGMQDSCCSPKADGKTVAAKQVAGIQTATVTVNGGYSPSTISVKAGKPVQLTFAAGKNLGCGSELVFKGMNVKRTLTPGSKTVVKFTPKKGQDLSFTCGMGMYKGKIVIK